MVSEENGNYKCGECGFIYKDKSWAEKCEMWCKINHSCNLQITKHSEKLNMEEKNNESKS
jgi:hypothetical protein